MREIELIVPAAMAFDEAGQLIERFCAEAGLQCSMKDTLARYPGSIHWHFRKPGARGTLEITALAKTRRVWAKIQAGRTAEWIEPSLLKIRRKFEDAK